MTLEKVKARIAKGYYCKETTNECLTIRIDDKSG